MLGILRLRSDDLLTLDVREVVNDWSVDCFKTEKCWWENCLQSPSSYPIR